MSKGICGVQQTEMFFHAPGPTTKHFERLINYIYMFKNYKFKFL